MPASIVIAIGEPGFAEKVAQSLAAAGHDAIAFSDSMVALHALEKARRIELLVTSVDHSPGKPNGVSLALMARMKRPELRAIFIGPADVSRLVEDLGALLTPPVSVDGVVDAVIGMLEAADLHVPASPQAIL